MANTSRRSVTFSDFSLLSQEAEFPGEFHRGVGGAPIAPQVAGHPLLGPVARLGGDRRRGPDSRAQLQGGEPVHRRPEPRTQRSARCRRSMGRCK